MLITKQELLKGRDIQFASEYNDVISDNLDKLLVPLNKIREAYGSPLIVNSGWRPPSMESQIPGAAKNSLHCRGLAVDFADPTGVLWKWVLENLQLMKDLGIYLESKCWTPQWTHMQLGPPISNHRIFIPSASRPIAPGAWDQIYDHEKYDG